MIDSLQKAFDKRFVTNFKFEDVGFYSFREFLKAIREYVKKNFL